MTYYKESYSVINMQNVDLIKPIHNYNFIKEAIRDALHQTYQNLNIIIDDGATHGTRRYYPQIS